MYYRIWCGILCVSLRGAKYYKSSGPLLTCDTGPWDEIWEKQSCSPSTQIRTPSLPDVAGGTLVRPLLGPPVELDQRYRRVKTKVKVVGARRRAAYLPSGVNSWPARPSTELCPQFLHGRAGPRPSQPPASKSAVPTRATLTRTNRSLSTATRWTRVFLRESKCACERKTSGERMQQEAQAAKRVREDYRTICSSI